MSHDHVGIPKLIQHGFANEEQTYCYDIIRNKGYFCNIDRLGTENNYYDEDVEKDLLANNVEYNFSLLYNDYCSSTDIDFMKRTLDNNVELIEQFFSFMYLRAKKALELINQESLTADLFGDFDHSNLLRMQTKMKMNIMRMIGGKYNFYPLINFADKKFINNSLGFGLMRNKDNLNSIVIPMNTKVAILISGLEIIENKDCLFIEPGANEKVDSINLATCRVEVSFGNGFIFGNDKELIESYIEPIEKMKNELNKSS